MRKWRWSAWALIAMMILALLPAVPASADISTAYGLVNTGFENGSANWGTYGTDTIVSSPVHSGTKGMNMTTTSTSTTGSIWQTIPVGGSGQPKIGEQVEADAWVYIDPAVNFSAGSSYLLVESINSAGAKTAIARSLNLDANRTGQWILIQTAPYGNSGKVPSDAAQLVVSIQHQARGTIIVDDFSLGIKQTYAHPNEYSLANNSFEGSTTSLTSWGTFGSSTVYTGDGYYGKQSAKFVNSAGSSTSIWQVVSLGSGAGTPQHGSMVEAGVWAYFNSDVNLSSGYFFVEVESYNATTGAKTVIAKSPAVSASIPLNRWVYLKTVPQNGGAVLSDASSIVVSIQSSMPGTIYADFCQVGDAGSVNGNPSKYAIAAYQPWFGNASDGSNGGIGWGNWGWTNGPTTPINYNHNPNNFLANGQRDIATAYYPLVGAYDSLDDNLLAYQFDLAKSELIDAFMVNDYGQVINQRFRQVENKMISLAEQKDMKFSVQYETKVNLNGWVAYPPGATRQDRLNGIQNDLKWILDNWAPRKGFLKYNGAAVLSVFGAYMLSDSEWSGIINNLKGMGYSFLIMGDNASSLNPNSDYGTYYNSFQSIYNWHFNDSTLAPSANPSYSTVYNFDSYNQGLTAKWAASGTNRLGVDVIWPGFNDIGTGGWGSGSIRQVAYLNGQTYDASTQAASESGINWVLIATWNDWNESTIIEPSKENGYLYAIKTQNFLEQFKGVAAVPDSQMQTITEAYMNNPNVIHYN